MKSAVSKRFERRWGKRRESAAAQHVALRFGLAASTVRSIDLRYLERRAASRRKRVLAQIEASDIVVLFADTDEDLAKRFPPASARPAGQDRAGTSSPAPSDSGFEISITTI